MYILFDIGGTKTRIARSLDGETFDEPLRFDTPQKYEDGLALLVENARSLSQGEVITGIAGGVPAVLDKDRTRLTNAPNLRGWENHLIVEDLSHALQTTVHIENDCIMVGLGEAHVGAGKGYDIVAYITVSTGVGGARIVNGKADESALGFEPGHQIINTSMQQGGEPSFKKATDLFSGAAIQSRFGKSAYLVDDPAVWEELALWLACALNNTIVHWSPNVVVVGGPMVLGNPAISLDRTKEHLKTMLTVYPTLPDIKQATLKDVGGIYGALSLLKTLT